MKNDGKSRSKTSAIINFAIRNFIMLNTDGELSGGAANIVSNTRSNHLHGFVGCIKDLMIDSQSIDLSKALT